MLSNRPYLARAFYEWIVDSRCTPILVLDAVYPGCKVPANFIEDNEIVFNISPDAVRDVKITNESLTFKASFSGVIHCIYAPIGSILAIYAEENGEGLFLDFLEEERENEAPGSWQGAATEQSPATEKRKPRLTVIEATQLAEENPN
jgi:stringent starvation protein B